MKVLHKFYHGLGDVIQFTAVLRHLKHHCPGQENHVITHRGKHSALGTLADQVFVQEIDASGYDRVIYNTWPECWNGYPDYPSTKAVLYIAEQLCLPVVPELLRYGSPPGAEARARADTYAAALPEPGFVCIHYQGDTSPGSKNLGHDIVAELCKHLLAHRFTPVILDWKRRSPLPDERRIFCPHGEHTLWLGYGTGDAETLAALLSRSALNICIDSGPQKVAMSVPPPLLAVWTGHHPVHFADPHPNTTHLIPRNHADHIRGNRPAALRYFHDHYDWHVYTDVLGELVSLALDRLHVEPLKKNPMSRSHLLKARSFDRDYYEEHRAAGLDYLNYGAWQEEYGRWLADVFELSERPVLDVGCAAGSITYGLHRAGARACGIDVNNHAVGLGRRAFADVPLYVCDTVNLHLFGDNGFDFVHGQQVSEHWRPELVPFILAEVKRVLRPGGLFFNVLDTEDLFRRQNREPVAEDATNQAVRPYAWWQEQLARAGLEDVKTEYANALRGHRLSFLKRYDWDWWLVRKP